MNNKTAENDTDNVCKTMQEWLKKSFEVLKQLSDEQIMLLFPELFN